MSDVAFMERANTPKENRTGRMTRLSDIIVGRVLPGIRRRHEEFSAPASSDRSAEGEWGAATGTDTPAAAGGRRKAVADQGENVGEAAALVTSTDGEPGPSYGDRALLYGETARHTPRGGLTGRASHFPAAHTNEGAVSPAVTSAGDATFHPTAFGVGRLAPVHSAFADAAVTGNPPLVTIANDGECTNPNATAPVVAGGGPARNPHALSRATAPCPLGYG